jgi:hypothetical protein
MGQETILRPILNSLKENVLSEILLIVMRDSNLTKKNINHKKIAVLQQNEKNQQYLQINLANLQHTPTKRYVKD